MAVLKKNSKEWTEIQTSKKKVQRNDVYVLGHTDVKMPAVVSSSSVKGVKARLVCKKKHLAGPPTSKVDEKDLVVIEEWSFDKDNQTKPVYFSSPQHIETDFWVEMMNPSKNDAIVNALVHGMIRSKSM